jgi:hypothetical protein
MDAKRSMEHVLRRRAGVLWFFYSTITSCLKLSVFIALLTVAELQRNSWAGQLINNMDFFNDWIRILRENSAKICIMLTNISSN